MFAGPARPARMPWNSGEPIRDGMMCFVFSSHCFSARPMLINPRSLYQR